MPFVVPDRQGKFTSNARGLTAYDSKGNFWGYFPTGRLPQCGITNFAVDSNCPLGALPPGHNASTCGCSGGCKGCYPKTIAKCPRGYTCKAFDYAPWGSCNLDVGIKF